MAEHGTVVQVATRYFGGQAVYRPRLFIGMLSGLTAAASNDRRRAAAAEWFD